MTRSFQALSNQEHAERIRAAKAATARAALERSAAVKRLVSDLEAKPEPMDAKTGDRLAARVELAKGGGK